MAGRIIAINGSPRSGWNTDMLIEEAVGFVRENLGVSMELEDIVCGYSPKNAQCIRDRCPFHGENTA